MLEILTREEAQHTGFIRQIRDQGRAKVSFRTNYCKRFSVGMQCNAMQFQADAFYVFSRR